MMRLYCGGGRFCIAPTVMEAERALGSYARAPTTEELTEFWHEQGLGLLTTREAAQKLGVSRQTVSNWAAKTGQLTGFQERMADRVERIARVLKDGARATEISERLGVDRSFVVKVAQSSGVKLRTGNQKRPPDDELLRMAKGRTWKELAKACGLNLTSLRHYVYKRPELAQALRQCVRKPTKKEWGRIDVDELKRMHAAGMSNYAIAQHFGCSSMSVKARLRRLADAAS